MTIHMGTLQKQITDHYYFYCATCGVKMTGPAINHKAKSARTRGHLLPTSYKGRKRWHVPQCRRCNTEQSHQTILGWGLAMKHLDDSRFSRVMDTVRTLHEMGVTMKELGADHD